LLLDAEEGLIGFDPISSLKPHLGTAFKSVTDRIRTAIADVEKPTRTLRTRL
jgi:hypothetical protein